MIDLPDSRAGTLAGFGPVMQIAYVPDDFDAALLFWTKTVGVGPFFVRENVAPAHILYRGEEARFEFDMAIGYWGDVQIELIRQHGDAPSIFSTWRKAGGHGVHHLCVVVDDMAPVRAAVAAAGGRIEQDVRMENDAAEAIYVDVGGGGTMIEYVRLSEPAKAGFAAMHAAARDWDGSDPVRRR